MRPARAATALFLAALLSVPPLAPARATDDGETSESRVGVILMIVCGVAAKFTAIAPVPLGGVAVVSCAFGLLDAALSPDYP